MSIALDVGVHRLRSLRRQDGRLLGRGCRTLYAALADTQSSRQLLGQMQIPYATCEDNLAVMGDAAAEFSRLFKVPSVSLLANGKLPHDDPPARQIIGSLVEALIPEPRHPNEICCMTLPGISSAQRSAGRRAYEFLTRLVKLRGYTPLVLASSMAVILAELVGESFTGIGLSLGAASCKVSLAHRGLELACCSIPVGGNWIDEELALQNNDYAWDTSGNRYLDTESASQWKESLSRSILHPADAREQFLSNLYRELVSHVVTEAARNFATVANVGDLPQPVSVVVVGGTARIAGFDKLLEQIWRATPFPLATKEFRVVADSDYTVARGCLINAELEAQTAVGRRSAA
jgi:hypothetical protein